MKMLWNQDKTESVVANKIRSYAIYETHMLDQTTEWKVVGWYNNEDSFTFGFFKSKVDAEEYLQQIHNKLES